MGAGGGFIMNPLLLTLFPVLPHTVVAGTVTPTVLFSQGSGIYNYSKIKFINWKLGAGIGCAMLLGGFIGPKLTEMVTLEQYQIRLWLDPCRPGRPDVLADHARLYPEEQEGAGHSQGIQETR